MAQLLTFRSWALGSGQGHGVWGPFEGKPDESGMEPQSVVTDGQGAAVVLYPFFRNAQEQTRTLTVSIRLEHPDYSYADSGHIDLPSETNFSTEQPYKIQMKEAAVVEITPLIDGQPIPFDNLYAVWSNVRSWHPDTSPEKTDSGKLRINGFYPGPNSLFVARMVDEKVTHFSDFKQLNLDEGSVTELRLSLQPSVRVAGKLSDGVPRPIRDGRVVARTLGSSNPDANNTFWVDWAPVAADGNFVFESWPGDERIQLIAICDGFIATSGGAPEKALEVENDGFHRPHVFDPAQDGLIEIPMVPLVPLSVTVTDHQNVPVAGLDIATTPNVGWWNSGSQIYANGLVQGKRRLIERDYRKLAENTFPAQLRGLTNSRGQFTFQLPVGRTFIEVLSDDLELEIDLGHREKRIEVVQGEPQELAIRVQPVGSERLGDWDKLAGVVYGCSTEEGRRILALPGMEEKMGEFTERFRDAKNQQDPKMLAEAYLIVAEAFLTIDETEEALKWRGKAKEIREER